MIKRLELEGKRFGRLLVVECVGRCGGYVKWKCLCDCGKETVVIGANLQRGNSTSCGCKTRESTSKSNTTHGKRAVSGYSSWFQMMSRCFDVKAKAYQNYGGRGITVCDRWRNVAEFLDDMGERPDKTLTIERINNNGHYSCGKCPECLTNKWPMNCQWATRAQQLRNTRRTRLFTIGDETMCLRDWCRRYKVSDNTVRYRLKHGMSIETALGLTQ